MFSVPYVIIYFLILIIAFMIDYITKRKYILTGFVIIFGIACIMGHQEEIADFDLYLYRYKESANIGAFESQQWAHTLFMQLFSKNGVDFLVYKSVFYFLGLSIIFIVAILNMSKPLIIIPLYCLFPMVIDAAQMKNFMAMAFMSLAFSTLKNKKIINLIYFCLLTVLAAGFQIVAYIYLPFIVFYIFSSSKGMGKYIPYIIIIFFAVFFTNRNSSHIIGDFIMDNVNVDIKQRISKFFNSSVNLGFIVFFITTFLVIGISYLCKKKVNGNNDSLSKVLFDMSIYSLAFLPLYFYAQDFSRLIRNYSIIIHIVSIVSISKSIKLKSNLKYWLISLYGIYIVYSFYWEIGIYWETVVEPFFSSLF